MIIFMFMFIIMIPFDSLLTYYWNYIFLLDDHIFISIRLFFKLLFIFYQVFDIHRSFILINNIIQYYIHHIVLYLFNFPP